MPPLIAVEKLLRELDRLHSYVQIAADAAPNHSLVAVLLLVGTAPAGSLHPCKIASSDPL